MLFRLTLAMLAAAMAVPAHAAIFQYAVPVTTPDSKVLTAYTWIPPAADRIRGVIIGGTLGAESALAQDTAVRAAAAAEKLAIIYVQPHMDKIFNYKEGKGPVIFQKVFDSVAEASGYPEIAVAPFFSIGHSMACHYATAVAAWNPSRCFGVLVFKGALVLPDYDPQADISGIPILALQGQFEQFGPSPTGLLRDYEDRETCWKKNRESYLRLRQANPRMLISLIVEAGATHGTWSARDGQYIALFIRKAAQVRIPDWPADAKRPVECKEIDVTTGALTNSAITNPRAARPAAYKNYQGDRSRSLPWQVAYWHVDLELAQAFDAYHAGRFNKRPQFVTFTEPETGKPIIRDYPYYKFNATFVGPDTFKVAGGFLSEVPDDHYPEPECPLGHADTPVVFRAFGGTAVQVGPDTFRVCMDGRNPISAAITAYHPGDATFRFAEQPARVMVPETNTKGKTQTIAFPAIGNLKTDSAPVKLAATSDSGWPVSYFVKSGPAVIEGDTLKLAEVPARAKYPIAITVGAYQWGSAVEPFVQSAKPVLQTVLLEE
jgi:hypothetical protein